jgi:hypothetical protein
MFIVIQKPNSNKVFLSSYSNEITRRQEDINTKYTRSIVVQIEENTVFPKD